MPSVEFVLSAGPDVIILLTDNANYSADDLLAKQPTWANIPAIANSRVHTIHPDLLSRPGPRLLLGIAEMTDLFNPETP